jgi:hypothetical protein
VSPVYSSRDPTKLVVGVFCKDCNDRRKETFTMNWQWAGGKVRAGRKMLS